MKSVSFFRVLYVINFSLEAHNVTHTFYTDHLCFEVSERTYKVNEAFVNDEDVGQN
jgi:hypothetical protein